MSDELDELTNQWLPEYYFHYERTSAQSPQCDAWDSGSAMVLLFTLGFNYKEKLTKYFAIKKCVWYLWSLYKVCKDFYEISTQKKFDVYF